MPKRTRSGNLSNLGRDRSRRGHSPSDSSDKRGGLPRQARGWDSLATWYDGMVGDDGSIYHKRVAIPTVLEFLELDEDDVLLDIGCGQGVLASYVAGKMKRYIGVDVGKRMIAKARDRYAGRGANLEFHIADARRLSKYDFVRDASPNKAVFLLSIQDMDPVEAVLTHAIKAITDGGKVVVFMLHPAFRIARQSGWGYDEGRKLVYRRVDSYLSKMRIPLKRYGRNGGGVSISYHRPLHVYLNTMARHGMILERVEELPVVGGIGKKVENDKARRRADREIPLFIAMRWRKT